MLSAELVDHLHQFLVFLAGPAVPRLGGEPAEAAVAHLGVSARNHLGHILEAHVLIAAQRHQQPVLLLAPRPLRLHVPLTDQVLAGNHDLGRQRLFLTFGSCVNLGAAVALGFGERWLQKGAGLGRNHYVIKLQRKGVKDVVHVFKNYDININPVFQKFKASNPPS